jgi:hypothetical protein
MNSKQLALFRSELRHKYEPEWVSRIEQSVRKQIEESREVLQDCFLQSKSELRDLGKDLAGRVCASAVKGSQSLGEVSIQAQLLSSVLIALIAINHAVSPEQVNLSVDDKNHIHIELLEKPMQKSNSAEILITLSKKDVDDYLSKINQYLLALSSATVVPSRLLLGLMKKNKEMGLSGLGYAAAAPLYVVNFHTGLGVAALTSIVETIGFGKNFSPRKKTDEELTLGKILLVIPDSFEYLKDKLSKKMPEASTSDKISAISAQDNINFSQFIEAVRGGALIVCPDSAMLINSLGFLQGLVEGAGMGKIADSLRKEAKSEHSLNSYHERQAQLLTTSALMNAIGKTFLETPVGNIGLIVLNGSEVLTDYVMLKSLKQHSTKPD